MTTAHEIAQFVASEAGLRRVIVRELQDQVAQLSTPDGTFRLEIAPTSVDTFVVRDTSTRDLHEPRLPAREQWGLWVDVAEAIEQARRFRAAVDRLTATSLPIDLAEQAALEAGRHHLLTYERETGTAVIADAHNRHRFEIAHADQTLYSTLEDVGELYSYRALSTNTVDNAVLHDERWSFPVAEAAIIRRAHVFVAALAEDRAAGTTRPTTTSIDPIAAPAPHHGTA